MSKNIQTFISIFVLSAGLAAPAMSTAVPVWYWTFDEPVQYVTPTESVLFTATLFNDGSSSEYIYGSANKDLGYWVKGASCCTSELNAQYNLNNPGVGGDVNQSPNFFDQFTNLALAPGESYNFTFLSLSPQDGTAEFGTYDFLSRLNLGYKTDGSILIQQYSEIDPSIVVGTGVAPVLEPASILLMLSGIAILLGFNFKAKT